MGAQRAVSPPVGYGQELRNRGGGTSYRCYQCGTCTSVCQLASRDLTFPRRQMALTQWGMVDALSSDPCVWLCHQCNDCTERCPRDARPGDIMQTARSLVVEHLAVPRFMGRLVAKAGTTWPVLLGVPLVFWIVVLSAVNGGLQPPASFEAFEDFVPHWLIYAVFFTVTGLVTLSAAVSGLRFWNSLDQAEKRQGGFVEHLMSVLWEVATHARFAKCGSERVRRWGHLSLMWGFVGAAVTSGFIIVVMYGLGEELPLPQTHWVKILGNFSALLLVVGVVVLVLNRFQEPAPPNLTSAFDGFFIGLVVLLTITGVLSEVGRLWFDPTLACYIYIGHLTVVLTLFATFPFSKFAHLYYRILALVHERMIQAR